MRLSNLTWPHAEEYFRDHDTVLIRDICGKNLKIGYSLRLFAESEEIIDSIVEIMVTRGYRIIT